MVPDSAEFYAKAPPDRGASSFVYPPTGANLDFFAKALEAGCLVAIPTETVYGLAGLALNETACRSIFAVKGRPLVDPLIVHVPHPSMVGELAVPPAVFDLVAEAFWPGPLTVVLRKRPIVPHLVTAGKDTVAIRMPRHPVAHALLERIPGPLAAPSANPFGYVSPSEAAHVAESFGNRVPFVIDGGPCEIGLESTILDLSEPDQPAILRPGAISAEQLTKVIGLPVRERQIELGIEETASAPGTFSRHYSPKSGLTLFPQGSRPQVADNEAVLFLKRPEGTAGKDVYWLSEDGSLNEVAKGLFSLLRKLDRAGYAGIHCELPSAGSGGIAVAIRDRMKRAAAK
ncbi:MAG: L-threonylcarbamoyladenylate synthase [Opitutales bacterium]